MSQSSPSFADRALAAGLFAGFLALYLTTLTQVHTFDALSYVTSVERKPWTELFHPHHLAYGPLGSIMLALGQAAGYGGGAAIPMQALNAVAGALGIALFFLAARSATGRPDAAFAAALLPGASYAYWYYSVEIEVYTLATLFLILCLALLIQPAPWSIRHCLALGLAHGGAVLFHQTNVLLGVPIAICLIADIAATRAMPANRPAILIQRWGAYAAALMLVVAIPYLYAMLVVSNFRTLDAMLAWLTEYARTGWWGGPLSGNTLANVSLGLTDTLAQPGGAWIWLALGVIAVGAIIAERRPGTRQSMRKPTAGAAFTPHPAALYALLAWLGVYGAFFTWWEPDNIEFWIASLPPAAMALAFLLARGRRWGLPILGTIAIGVTMTWLNYSAIERRGDPTTDLQRVVARELGARSTPADLLIIPDGLLELYLPYYERHENFVSLNQALFDNNGTWNGACAAIQQRIDTAQHAGAAVIIADETFNPPERLLARHNLNQQAIDDCFMPYRDLLVDLGFRDPLPAYWRLPDGSALATAGGWRFDRYPQGWQGLNIAAARVDNGWSFTPQTDPALLSPLLNLDAGQFVALEIRMANATTARDAQLFYAGSDGAIAEQRSIRWELAATAEMTTYTLDLRAAPGWDGVITRLRLDPVGVGDGGMLRIESIRLLPASPNRPAD